MLWRKKKMHQDDVLRCSFCNKDQNDVAKLIAGPTVFICNECVEVCSDIIADDDRFSRAGEASGVKQSEEPPSWPRATRCALCHAEIPSGDGIIITGNRGTLCIECVQAVARTQANG